MNYIHLATISMLPVVELRGAIPIGISYGLSTIDVYITCVLASTLVAIPLIIFFRKALYILKKHKVFYKIGHIIDEKINKRMKKLKSVSILGIIMFVAIPLPTTGVWTTSAIASLLKMRIKYAILGIFIGNMISGILVSILSLGIIYL